MLSGTASALNRCFHQLIAFARAYPGGCCRHTHSRYVVTPQRYSTRSDGVFPSFSCRWYFTSSTSTHSPRSSQGDLPPWSRLITSAPLARVSCFTTSGRRRLCPQSPHSSVP